jgi:hypothetical protein
MQRFLFVSCVALAGCKPSTAADTPGPKVAVVVMPATYASTSDAPAEVVEKCKFDKSVAQSIVERTPGSTLSTGTASKILNMEVVAMRGVDPTWEGESRVIIRGELVDGGTTIGSFRIKRSALGGVFGGMKSICKALDNIAEDMGEDIGVWLRDPKMDTELEE